MENSICSEVSESVIFGEYESLREGWMQNRPTWYKTVFSEAFSASCFLQHFASPCYTVSCRKTPPDLQIVRSISQQGRYKGILFSSTNSRRSLMLLGLFQHSFDRIHVAPKNFSLHCSKKLPKLPMLTLTPWPDIQRERIGIETFIPDGAPYHLESHPNTEPLIFYKRQLHSSVTRLTAVMSLKCRTRLSLRNGTKPSNKLKYKIRTWGSDECHPKHCFVSASHPFFFQWLLLTAGLIRNSQKILFKKNKKSLEKDTVFFLLCFFLLVCLPLKGYSQNLITNFHPVQIKRSLKNINFVIRCFPKKQGHSQQIQHPYLHENPNSLFLTCNTYFARANIEIT